MFYPSRRPQESGASQPHPGTVCNMVSLLQNNFLSSEMGTLICFPQNWSVRSKPLRLGCKAIHDLDPTSWPATSSCS